jgi:AcrR family transcriptional regulator
MERRESPTVGLRERKKQQTRETIARAALELFDAHGFADTTIPAIAAAADVSPRTVSAYFPAKEDLVFPDADRVFGDLATMLRDREDGTTTADALRAWITRQIPVWSAHEAEARVQRRVVDGDPALQAHEQRLHADAERLVATSIADDLDASPDDLEPRMAAAATFAIFGTLGDHKEAGGGPADRTREEEGREMLALLDRALQFVDAGIRALRDGEGTPFLRDGPASGVAAV